MSQPQKKPDPLTRLEAGVAAVKSGADPAKEYAKAIATGTTPAWFTAHELLALQRICRDADDERGVKILADAVKRADRS